MTTNTKNKVWITWEYQVRNRSMARELDMPIVEIVYDESSKARYFLCIFDTIKYIHKHKPDIVFHQSPSIILALIIQFLKVFYRFKTVTDCHNAGIFPLEGKSKLLNFIAAIPIKLSNLMIVHNKKIQQAAVKLNPNSIVLADPLPDISDNTSIKVDNDLVVFICRWSLDEPYNEVIAAAKLIEQTRPNVKIKITGKIPSAIDVNSLPNNIELVGFLSNEEYANLIHQASLLIALTTRNDSLNCAGYEAMSYETPMILSDTEILRRFFNQGYEYTRNGHQEIAQTIEHSLDNLASLNEAIKAKKQTYQQTYTNDISELKSKILKLIS